MPLMHPEAYAAVGRMADELGLLDVPLRGVDFGGADHNGTGRAWFRGDVQWEVVDLVDGDEVTMIGDLHTMEWTPHFDLVLCTEVLEHDKGWRDLLRCAYEALTVGGCLLLTCASYGRQPHGATGAPAPAAGEHYGNVHHKHLEEALIAQGFTDVAVTYAYPPGDAYARATRSL